MRYDPLSVIIVVILLFEDQIFLRISDPINLFKTLYLTPLPSDIIRINPYYYIIIILSEGDSRSVTGTKSKPDLM